MVKTQFGVNINSFLCDSVKEFVFTNFLITRSTQHQFFLCGETHQNLIVEKKHQHILNVVELYIFNPCCQSNFGKICFHYCLSNQRDSIKI